MERCPNGAQQCSTILNNEHGDVTSRLFRNSQITKSQSQSGDPFSNTRNIRHDPPNVEHEQLSVVRSTGIGHIHGIQQPRVLRHQPPDVRGNMRVLSDATAG
mmetsp:Transcript_5226/g.6385  ORF Transcript_5226/g.6385 Transcript_5226/m.6385 type:complete len:102 (+) Transcript_5226:645-950(+)